MIELGVDIVPENNVIDFGDGIVQLGSIYPGNGGNTRKVPEGRKTPSATRA
jgi:hypothetical protein